MYFNNNNKKINKINKLAYSKRFLQNSQSMFPSYQDNSAIEITCRSFYAYLLARTFIVILVIISPGYRFDLLSACGFKSPEKNSKTIAAAGKITHNK